MAIRIITDSASDVSAEMAEKYGITVVPLCVTFGERQYLSGVTLGADDFYCKLIESDTLPVTSQVSPYQWEEVFKKAIQEGDTPIAITVSSHLSGTYRNACMAASEMNGRAFAVDSLNASLGEAVLVQLAAEKASETAIEPKVLCALLNEKRKAIRILALLDTLEYLKKGGRISSSAALIGGLLALKPVVTIDDGEVKAIGKARGSRSGNNLLKELAVKDGGINFDMPYMLAYSGTDTKLLDKYINDSEELWKGKTDKLPSIQIGPTVGTYIGPGGIALAYFSKVLLGQ